MECPLCGHVKAHKHGTMPNGHQRYRCPACHQTFCESFDSLVVYQAVHQYGGVALGEHLGQTLLAC
ncbi:MAG: hypothetical protein KME45_08870 [Stenomitos rutilans HA7619-LM2]|jgi:transposase-like protein|nr:hypothetical protein [Stenomitos rutilans HA7619-LM2]